MSNYKMEAHEKAVRVAFNSLKQLGLEVNSMPKIGCHFDLWVNKKVEVEIKVATKLQKDSKQYGMFWKFNLHRHGKIPKPVDFYVFRIPNIEEFGFRYGISLVVPASELHCKTLIISPRTLMTTFGKWYARWDLIKAAATT